MMSKGNNYHRWDREKGTKHIVYLVNGQLERLPTSQILTSINAFTESPRQTIHFSLHSQPSHTPGLYFICRPTTHGSLSDCFVGSHQSCLAHAFHPIAYLFSCIVVQLLVVYVRPFQILQTNWASKFEQHLPQWGRCCPVQFAPWTWMHGACP